MRQLDITVTIRMGDDGRPKLSDYAARQIQAFIQENTEGMEPGQDVRQRWRLGPVTRSLPQNNLYHAMLGAISLALDNGGRPMSTAKLHLHYKGKLLPLVAARVLEETGEEVDIGTYHELPGGRSVLTRTTTRLSVPAFSLLIEYVASSDIALGSGADLSKLLSDTRELVASGKIKSGRIPETDEEASVNYLLESGEPMYPESEAVLTRTMADLYDDASATERLADISSYFG